MRRLTTMLCVAAAGAVAVLPGAATADHCPGSVVIPVGSFYVDDRSSSDGGTWIYMESNGLGDLQSGGTSIAGESLGGKDPCEHPTPDQIIF